MKHNFKMIPGLAGAMNYFCSLCGKAYLDAKPNEECSGKPKGNTWNQISGSVNTIDIGNLYSD